MKKLITGALLTLVMSSFTTVFGLDGYDIYVNNKIVMKGYVNQPLDARVLFLDKAATAGQLGVVYRHCRLNNGPGSGRSLALKDETGSVLRKWEFSDNQPMNLPVKELLQPKGHQLSLYYTAHELDKAELLAMIRFK